MVVKSLILMRHAEREDRAVEKEGKDWISTAPRPHDPQISAQGRKQAAEVGRQLRDAGITKILCSPLIRTVQTADIIAEALGLGENSLCVEHSLVEQARSFRGKTGSEPRPNWDPLLLPLSELQKYSSRIDMNYTPVMMVHHVRDDSLPNTVREVHETLSDRDEVTKDRFRVATWKIIQDERLHGDVVLCVAHGASVKHISRTLEANLPEEQHCKGEQCVSCFSRFEPVDPTRPLDAWRSVYGEWRSGDILHNACDDPSDRGNDGM